MRTIYQQLSILVILSALLQGLPTVKQIDVSDLLFNQEVHAYLQLDKEKSKNLQPAQVKVMEYYKSGEIEEYEVKKIIPQANTLLGIDWVFLLDNSGSMYKPASTQDNTLKIDNACNALKNLLNGITNAEDNISIALFNTWYNPVINSEKNDFNWNKVYREIVVPDSQSRATELYYAIDRASRTKSRRRKVIIVLSDGVNYTFKKWKKQKSPEYGDKTFSAKGVREACLKRGLTVYAVHYGGRQYRDSGLAFVAKKTGGVSFSGANYSELVKIFHKIKNEVGHEYRITWQPKIFAGQKRKVKVTLQDQAVDSEYYVGSLYGDPLPGIVWWIFLPLLLVPFLLNLLYKIKWHNTNTEAFLSAKPGKVKPGKNDVKVKGNQTVCFNTKAMITYDEKLHNFTVITDEPLKINNRKAQSGQPLHSGDVISIAGQDMVFDAGES